MTELPNISSFLARSCRECGFEREKFIDKRVPEDFNKIVVFVFFGDLRSLSILSLLLFKPFRDNILKDKYVIVCSYPGMGCFFPNADEYWSVSDGLVIGDLMNHASGFGNTDKKIMSFNVELRRRFYNVLTDEDLQFYYKNGLTTGFFDRFKKIERYFPAIPHWRGNEFQLALLKQDKKGIFIYPNMQGKCWDRGKEVSLSFPKDFWIKLTERLLENKYLPIVYQNQVSYDISPYFGEKCFYCSDRNFLSVLGAMRSAGCVLDVFSGISRMSIVARCPFLALDERQRYVRSKEFEINDLCIAGMYLYRYIISFPTVIGSGNHVELIDQIMNAVTKFVSKTDLPPASESYDEVLYDNVREFKAKKLGANFIRVEKLNI